jgi:hypothetical protein
VNPESGVSKPPSLVRVRQLTKGCPRAALAAALKQQ